MVKNLSSKKYRRLIYDGKAIGLYEPENFRLTMEFFLNAEMDYIFTPNEEGEEDALIRIGYLHSIKVVYMKYQNDDGESYARVTSFGDYDRKLEKILFKESSRLFEELSKNPGKSSRDLPLGETL